MSVGSCQGNWTAPQGVLYSPDFPDEYGPDRNCSWLLGPAGSALELTFRLFELADPRDRLELRDAASGRLLRAFDGARPPPPGPLRLRPAALLLTFRSDARGHAQGFALTYRGELRPRPAPAAPAAPALTPLSAGLRDAEDGERPRGSAQTPAGSPTNASCSPRPGAPQARPGGEGARRAGGRRGVAPGLRPHRARVPARSPSPVHGDRRVHAAAAAPVAAAAAVPTVRAWGAGGALVVPKRGPRRERGWDPAHVCSLSRSCLLAAGKRPLALGPSQGARRSWAVWYRRPRGVALPCPSVDAQTEGPAAGYHSLSASSQSSLRSLISAL